MDFILFLILFFKLCINYHNCSVHFSFSYFIILSRIKIIIISHNMIKYLFLFLKTIKKASS